ncbi:unnamed protein product, partial [Heterotrigona itama]
VERGGRGKDIARQTINSTQPHIYSCQVLRAMNLREVLTRIVPRCYVLRMYIAITYN